MLRMKSQVFCAAALCLKANNTKATLLDKRRVFEKMKKAEDANARLEKLARQTSSKERTAAMH
jgi:hypothetical protein